jgi:hypothetical protein
MSLFGDQNEEFNWAEDYLRNGIIRLMKEGKRKEGLELATEVLFWAINGALSQTE